jgi:hypothetical protein
VQSAFEWVIWIVCGLGFVIALAALLGTKKTWEGYGKGRLVMDGELTTAPRHEGAASNAERDDEIRQLLEARNLRRARRGEAPVDVEQELSRLVGPRIDAALREEIREMVHARNYRRLRQGKPPLDIESEVERQIKALPQS